MAPFHLKGAVHEQDYFFRGWRQQSDNEPIISSAGAILAIAVAVWKLVGLYSGKGVKSPAPVNTSWRNNTWRNRQKR